MESKMDRKYVIAEAAAKLVSLSMRELRSPKRGQHISYQRHEWCWYMRQMGFSYPCIGEVVNRDHATVMNSCMRMDAKFANGWKARLSQNLEILRSLGLPNDVVADFDPLPEAVTMRVDELMALYEHRRKTYQEKANVCDAALASLQNAMEKLRAA